MPNFIKCLGYISKKTPLTSLVGFSSNGVDGMQESFGGKLDWEGAKSFFLKELLDRELYINLSEILPKIDSKLIGP